MRATRRSLGFCVAGWYALVSTGGAYGILDAVAPITKTVANPNFACALHPCACKTSGQCKTRCCCFPKTLSKQLCSKHPQVTMPLTVNVTRLESAKCSGDSPVDRDASKRLQPHLWPATEPELPPLAREIFSDRKTIAVSLPCTLAIDKIPI